MSDITSGARDNIQFLINGKQHTVSKKDNFNGQSKLVDFIREEARLKGTKIMCREGLCGVCIVTVHGNDPISGERYGKAVPSCTVPLFSCDGWEISTIEYLGSKKEGYHPIQKSLVDHNGIQCGFCSPGMVMTMHSRMESPHSDVSIEDLLDGNVCRCTGYRPILDAFKAVDADGILRNKDCKGCPIKPQTVSFSAKAQCAPTSPAIGLNLVCGQRWVKVHDLNAAFCVLKYFVNAGKPYKVIAGLNEQGASTNGDDPVENYLDVTAVQELLAYSLDPEKETGGFVVGGSVTFSTFIALLKNASKIEGYEYALDIADHLERGTNISIRNIATLGEELCFKNKNREFLFDLFVYLEAAGARITLRKYNGIYETISLLRFLVTSITGKLVISLQLPRMKGYSCFRAFKISPRYQNTKAILTAGILLKVDPDKDCKVVERPSIVFGGIRSNFVHAWGTEVFLLNKSLKDESVIQGAMRHLDKEVQPDAKQDEPSPFYRKSLTKSLLYKTILGIIGDDIAQSKIKSGGTDIVRRPNKGIQDHGGNIGDGIKPLYSSVQRQDAALLSSGEAEFVDDIPKLDCELFGAFVLTTVAKCQLDSVDASEALKMDCVVRFIVAKDIPGVNNCMAFGGAIPVVDVEPIFVFDEVKAAGQAIGLILAANRDAAYQAARKVKVTYKNAQKPILTMKESLTKVDEEGTLEKHTQVTLKTLPNTLEIPTRVSGEHEQGPQYHFTLETQSCLCIPKEDEMDVHCSTQWMDHTQAMIAVALGVYDNYVNVRVKRVGGAFGSRITRATHSATACAVAAYVTNRPVRVILDMKTNMRMIGKREPYICRYHVKFSETGKIVSLKAMLFSGPGWTRNEAYAGLKLPYFQNVYSASNWEALAGYLLTDTPANTYARAPGGLNSIALIEYIMEHITFVLKRDPFDVRAANYIRMGDPLLTPGMFFEGENLIPRMVEELKISGEYKSRKRAVEQFNQENRWKKRGLAVSTSSDIVEYGANTYVAYVAIYHHDGTVAVSHSGIEFGTGVNIKVAQTVATFLDVPVEKVKVKANNNLTGNNSGASKLSISSELNAYAAMQACKILLERLAPIKQRLPLDATLQTIADVAFHAKVDLSASYMFGGEQDAGIRGYLTFQVVINEVEVDILTGEWKMVRVDILEDVGRSLNPVVDLSQIEGGFIFGTSLWTLEQILYDEKNGQLLTDRAYNYRVAESRDIPEDFRVALLSNSFNRRGVLNTKASGEPPTNLGVVVLFAIKNAINAARRDVGNEEWFQMNGPVTLENIFTYSLTSSSDFTLT